MEVPRLQNPSSRRTWLIAGLAAAILFIGAVASNIIANYIQARLDSRLVWLLFVIAFVVTVAIAIVKARRPPPVSNEAENSRTVTGDKVHGDANFRDRITTYNIQQGASASLNALHQLRAPVGDFVGREREIETLINALRHDSGACISGINGMGGIGKTELALFVAQHLSADYPDARFFMQRFKCAAP